MTKVRPPVTFQHAVTRIAGRLGWDVAAAAVSKAERTVRNWSDPDTGALPTVDDAMRLDAAFLAAGGGDAPLHAVYAQMLDRGAQGAADPEAITASAAQAAKEAGEAVSALVLAARPGASQRDRAVAEHETSQAIEAFTGVLTKLGTTEGVR